MTIVRAKLARAPRLRQETMPGGKHWESPFTRPGLASRRLVRRRRNKAARAARRANR